MRLDELLDDAVFERVEADHREPPAEREQLERAGERAAQLAELVVDVHAQRLEGARRRDVLPGSRVRTARATSSASCSVRVRGWLERLATMSAAMRRAKRSSPECRDHLANLRLARSREPCGNRFAARRVHAHVERAVRPEAETT